MYKIFNLLSLFLSFLMISVVISDIGRCRMHEFRCSNTNCIPSTLQCDGRDDCGDYSDEQCERQDLFACSDNIMISKSKLCDGKNDCSNDENFDICEKKKCSSEQFLCRSKPMKCIDISEVCNNANDCPDNSDESPAACQYIRDSKIATCNNDHFRCANKLLCVSKIFRCDGNNDCSDESDEMNCPKLNCHPDSKNCLSIAKNETKNVETNPCNENEFYCGKESTTQCITVDWLCDTSIDCEITGNDEKNCKNFECTPNKPNKCKSVDECYEDQKKCDGFNDCSDKSDEEDCKKPLKEAVCDPNKEYKCVKNNTCIPWKNVCDGKDHCGDLSDERPGGSDENCKKRPCEKNNGNCDQICVSLYSSRKCLCRPGFRIDPLNETKCIDINECVENNTCSHICKNLIGSFKCECFEGFYKGSDNGSCSVVGEKFLLFSTKNAVRELRLLHHYMEMLSPPIDKNSNFVPVGIDFDYKSKLIFYTQVAPTPEIIQIRHSFAKTNNLLQTSLVNKRIHSPIGLAYDWIHGLLFWTDIHLNEISVLNVTNGMRRVLLKLSNSSKVRSIVVHPKYRTIYWTDWGDVPKIESMGMDGNDRKVLVKDGLLIPNGLAIDYNFNELYWMDTKARHIKSFNLKTSKETEVVTHLNVHGFEIDVFEDWLYLSDWHNENIIQIHKKTGFQKLLINSPKPMGVKLFHQLVQKENIENVCIDNPCQYLCLPAALNLNNFVKFRCLCPDNSYLLNDNKSCSPVQFEYSNFTNSIARAMKDQPIKRKANVYLIVGFVMALVLIILVLVILLGVAMYRNYKSKVIKRATNFNNPTYYNNSNLEIRLIYPNNLIPESNISPTTELIPKNQSDDGLQMMESC